jgi:hypothetical protein
MVEQHRLGPLIAVDRPNYFISKTQMVSIGMMAFNAMILAMGRRLDAFPGEPSRGQRRYPWDEWTDGSAWQIRRGEDYGVATENMRVNLHMKADSLFAKVRTHKFDDDQGEGLIFQFFDLKEVEKPSQAAAEHSDGCVSLTGMNIC